MRKVRIQTNPTFIFYPHHGEKYVARIPELAVSTGLHDDMNKASETVMKMAESKVRAYRSVKTLEHMLNKRGADWEYVDENYETPEGESRLAFEVVA